MKNFSPEKKTQVSDIHSYKKVSPNPGQMGLQKKLQEMELEELMKIELFNCFNKETLLRIIEESPLWRLGEEEILFEWEGEQQKSMYIILTGRVVVFKSKKIISYLSTGDYVGELPLVDSNSRSASVKSMKNTLLLEINETIFQKYIASNSKALVAMMKVFAQRIRNDLARMESDMRKMSCFTHDMRNVLLPLKNSESYLQKVLQIMNGTEEGHIRRDGFKKLKMGVDTIIEVRDYVTTLIDQSLACVKKQQGEYVKDSFDILALAKETVKEISCHKQLEHKTLRVESPESKVIGKINYLDIKRVLQNLIINAGYATQKKDQIVCIVKNMNHAIEISIEDNGSGIPDDIKPFILKESFSSKPDGNGIGLISCKEIIEKYHNGKIGFESHWGKGTKFCFTLPKSIRTEPKKESGQLSQTNITDDNAITRKLELLKQIDLFDCLPLEAKVNLAKESRDVVLKARDVLIKEGARDEQYLHILLRGKVRISKGPNYQKVITDLNPGEYFGEISLIDNLPRSASAVALTDGLIIEIDKDLFAKYIVSNSKALLEMMKVCSRRLRNDLDTMSNDVQQLSHFTHDMKNCLVPLEFSKMHFQNTLEKLTGSNEQHNMRKGLDKLKKGLEVMISVKNNMVSMIDQSLACVQKGTREYPKKEIDIFDLVKEVKEEIGFHDDIKNKKVTLLENDSNSIGPVNTLDIKRVLQNMILNAGYASQKNSEICVSVEGLEEFIEVRIEDKGTGIPEEIKRLLFNENFTSQPDGDGFGLMSCKEIIEEGHKGKIGFKSEIGKGSTFFFTIPRSN